MSPAIEHCVMSLEMLRAWAGDAIKDMTEEELLFQPAEKRNHAWWIFGHMVLSVDIARYLSGTAALTPKEWEPLFDYGTFPAATGENYPSKEELAAQFNKNVDAVVEALKQMTDDQLSEEPAVKMPEALRDFFKTKGGIITGYAYHCMFHHGQIETIRKMLGK